MKKKKKKIQEHILLQFAESTTEEGIIWYGQLGFVSSFWIDNLNVCFLAKIPWVKILSSEVPDTNIVQRHQNCCPCSRINLKQQKVEEACFWAWTEQMNNYSKALPRGIEALIGKILKPIVASIDSVNIILLGCYCLDHESA